MKSKKSKRKTISRQPLSIISSMQNCTAKRKYRNEVDAMRAAEIQMLADMNLELNTYKCDVCRHWHLTRV